MKTLLLATAIALSFAPACFSQQNPGDEKMGEVPTSPYRSRERSLVQLEEDSARITTEMKKTQYRGGEDAILQITLKNVGTKTFLSADASLSQKVYEFYDIDITNQTDKKILQLKVDDGPITGGAMGWGLAPNKTQKASVWLNNLFDLAHSGKYKVVVSKKFRKDGKVITISSEPLEFEITSKKPLAYWESTADEN